MVIALQYSTYGGWVYENNKSKLSQSKRQSDENLCKEMARYYIFSHVGIFMFSFLDG